MDLLRRDDDTIFHTYKRLPLAVTHGRGMELFTADGRAYLDMFAGVAVNALGYAHPGLLAAVADQAARYIHVSNYFAQEPQVRLAELLTRASGYERVFFANSGTETTEGALKLARRWGTGAHETGSVRPFQRLPRTELRGTLAHGPAPRRFRPVPGTLQLPAVQRSSRATPGGRTLHRRRDARVHPGRGRHPAGQPGVRRRPGRVAGSTRFPDHRR